MQIERLEFFSVIKGLPIGFDLGNAGAGYSTSIDSATMWHYSVLRWRPHFLAAQQVERAFCFV
jgi:hypothetical protein